MLFRQGQRIFGPPLWQLSGGINFLPIFMRCSCAAPVNPLLVEGCSSLWPTFSSSSSSWGLILSVGMLAMPGIGRPLKNAFLWLNSMVPLKGPKLLIWMDKGYSKLGPIFTSRGLLYCYSSRESTNLEFGLRTRQAFFWPFEKKLTAKKTQNSRKKLKLKLTTQIFGIFRKNSTFSEKMFYPS